MILFISNRLFLYVIVSLGMFHHAIDLTGLPRKGLAFLDHARKGCARVKPVYSIPVLPGPVHLAWYTLNTTTKSWPDLAQSYLASPSQGHSVWPGLCRPGLYCLAWPGSTWPVVRARQWFDLDCRAGPTWDCLA